MGDICLSSEVHFLNNIESVLQPFFQVAEQCLVDDTEDTELNLLKAKLRAALLDAFASAAFCLTQAREPAVAE
jgi:hypothetical protein